MKLPRTAILSPILLATTFGGLQSPPSISELNQDLYGSPCDCKGGYTSTTPFSNQHTHTTDCGTSTAYLTFESLKTGGQKASWKCVNIPKIIPSVNSKPGPCPQHCQQSTQMHSTCYTTVQQCTNSEGKVQLTAALERTYSGSFGGEYDYSNSRGSSKYAQASCQGTIGKPVCWPPQAPTQYGRTL